jgi:hypothetical protein
VPAAARVAVLVSPAKATDTDGMLRELETATRAMGLQIQVTSGEIDAAFATFGRERPDALFVSGGPFCSADVFNWSCWRRATRSPPHMVA